MSEEKKEHSKEIKRLIEAVRTHNALGNVADEDFIRRNFANVVFENEQKLSDVIKNLVLEETFLKFNYVDQVWYVAVDRYGLEEVTNKHLESEERATTSQIAQTKNKEERKRLDIKQSVLKSIKEVITKKLATLSLMNAEVADKVMKGNHKLQGLLHDMIVESTRKFKNTLNTKDLTTTEVMRKNFHNFSNASFPQVMEVLTALEFVGKILIVPMPDHEKLFIDYSQFDQKLISHLDRERKSAKNSAEHTQTDKGVGEKNQKRLGEYNNFMLLDNILKMIEQRATQDFLKARKAPGSRPQEDSSQQQSDPSNTDKKSHLPTKAEPTGISAVILNDLKEKFVLVPEDVEIDVQEELFVEDLSNEKLDEELLAVVEHEESQLLLKGYLDEIRKGVTEIDRKIYFRTFFSCLSMLIRIPSPASRKIYHLSKVYLTRLAIQQLELERKKIAEQLELAYANYQENRTEELIMDSRPRLDQLKVR